MAQVRIPRNIAELIREVVRVCRDPALFMWALFVLLVPVYVFKSGLPQPGDLILLPLAAVALRSWDGRLNRHSVGTLKMLLGFTAWVIVVDWGWALALGNFGVGGPDTFLLFPLYYIFNTVVYLIACVLYQRHGVRFLWLTLHLVLASVILQVGATFVIHRSPSFRGMGLFNNPNQLGFFALTCAAMMALGKRRLGFGAIKSGLGVTACLFLALVSASRAAVGGIAILLVLSLVTNPRRAIVACLAVLGLVSIGGPVAEGIEGTQQRVEVGRENNLSFFQQRGYDRIMANSEYLVLGAGEGGTSRFAATTAIGGAEVHSSAGTILFSYGIIGVGLFGTFLFRLFGGTPLRSKLILISALSYTAAHQGLRASSVWILFGLYIALKDLQYPKRAVRPVAPALPAGVAV